MQFLIIGIDGTDSEVTARRESVRAEHIKLGDQLVASGNMWYGAALLNQDGGVKGSMLMMDFSSENELHVWLDREPYVVGEVWETVEIHKCKTRDPWQFNRPKDFFETRN